jgi:hypothetical protein
MLPAAGLARISAVAAAGSLTGCKRVRCLAPICVAGHPGAATVQLRIMISLEFSACDHRIKAQIIAARATSRKGVRSSRDVVQANSRERVASPQRL